MLFIGSKDEMKTELRDRCASGGESKRRKSAGDESRVVEEVIYSIHIFFDVLIEICDYPWL